MDVRGEAERFKRLRDAAEKARDAQLTLAKIYAERYGVFVYVYPTEHGFDMGPQRPLVDSAWRVAPSGNVTFVGSGQ